MLDVRPVHVFSREGEIGLDRRARVVGISDDEPADDEQAVSMEDVDRGERRVLGAAGLRRLFLAVAFRKARSSSSTFSMPRKT